MTYGDTDSPLHELLYTYPNTLSILFLILCQVSLIVAANKAE